MGKHNAKFVAELKTVGSTPEAFDRLDGNRQKALLNAIRLEKNTCTCGRPKRSCRGHSTSAPAEPTGRERDNGGFSNGRNNRRDARQSDIAAAKAVGRGAVKVARWMKK